MGGMVAVKLREILESWVSQNREQLQTSGGNRDGLLAGMFLVFLTLQLDVQNNLGSVFLPKIIYKILKLCGITVLGYFLF